MISILINKRKVNYLKTVYFTIQNQRQGQRRTKNRLNNYLQANIVSYKYAYSNNKMNSPVDPHRITPKAQPSQHIFSHKQMVSQPRSLPTTQGSSGSPIDFMDSGQPSKEVECRVRAFELYPISQEKVYDCSKMEEFTSQKKGLFELDNYISSIRCSPESGKHIDELERIEQMMQNWLEDQKQNSLYISEGRSYLYKGVKIVIEPKSESQSYRPPTHHWFSSAEAMTRSTRHRKGGIRHVYSSDINMGNNGPCCGKETDQPTSMRELLSLQDTEACRSWMEPFLNEFPKIRQVYTKKPIYCYRIDRQQYTQKQDMTCIGKIPAKGSAGELIIMYKEGYLYQGDVVEGIREGCGRMISADGDCYEGQWKGNEPDGEGTYEQYAPKRKLTGVWSSGFLNGKGRAIYEDGSVYQGDFYQNSRHGKGRIQYSDGTIYEGGFKANLMEGFGTLIGINHKYEGSWKAGKMEGAGKSYWYNQDDELLETYEGEYLNGLKHGMGEYRWSNGRVYAGQWQHGQIKEKIMEELKQSVKTR